MSEKTNHGQIKSNSTILRCPNPFGNKTPIQKRSMFRQYVKPLQKRFYEPLDTQTRHISISHMSRLWASRKPLHAPIAMLIQIPNKS